MNLSNNTISGVLLLLLLTYRSAASDKSVVVVAANGCKEIELVTVVDILRRAGAIVHISSLSGNSVVYGSQKIAIRADQTLSADEIIHDAIVLPGGMVSSQTMVKSSKLGALLKQYESRNKYIAAICAAPLALKAHKIFSGKNLTLYPHVKAELQTDYNYLDKSVVVDGNLITSRGPGAAAEFAFALVKILFGEKVAQDLKRGMLFE